MSHITLLLEVEPTSAPQNRLQTLGIGDSSPAAVFHYAVTLAGHAAASGFSIALLNFRQTAGCVAETSARYEARYWVGRTRVTDTAEASQPVAAADANGWLRQRVYDDAPSTGIRLASALLPSVAEAH